MRIKKMQKLLILLVVCPIGSVQYAQISFEKTITLSNSSTKSKGYAVIQTSDQGYAIAAEDDAGGNHGVLIRTNAYGDNLWTKSLNGIFFDIRQTADGGYGFADVADYSQYKFSKIFLVRTDGDGTVLWTQKYGDTHYYLGRSMFQYTDGGFIICGYDRTMPSGGESSLCLAKTSSEGTLEWMRSYHKSFSESGMVVMPTDETRFLAVGTTGESLFISLYLVLTDSVGDTIWTKTISVRQPGNALSATTVAQGGYLLAATVADTVSNSNNIQLIRINDNGDTLWTRQVGSLGHEYV